MKTDCDSCINNAYNEQYDCYECIVNLDEDDMARLMGNKNAVCPYFQYNNEYKIVNKQI